MASSSRRAAGYPTITTTAILGFMMLRLAASLPHRGSAFLAIATPSALQERRGSSTSFPQISLSFGAQSSRLHTTASTTTTTTTVTTTTALRMVRNRGGLERRREGATPTGVYLFSCVVVHSSLGVVGFAFCLLPSLVLSCRCISSIAESTSCTNQLFDECLIRSTHTILIHSNFILSIISLNNNNDDDDDIKQRAA